LPFKKGVNNMKKFLSLAILVIAGLTSKAQIEKVSYRGAFAPAPAAAWTDTWTEWDPKNKVYPSATAAPAGGALLKYGSGYSATTPGTYPSIISKDTTWYAKNTYIIAGLVYIKPGVTLTIQPGTVIFGSNAYSNSSLIVTKGAKLNAVGKVDSAIVFTSMYPVGQRNPGDWGGIVMLGKAPYNGISSSTSPTPNTFGINYIEGITEVNNTTTGESTEFGGGTSPKVNDTSGTLRYVRIEFGGYIFAQNKEINGLTLGAVGKGTTIDYVQCSYINDDAFEWFGGNVNCTHLISYRGVDDEWDTDNGFSGSVQYALGVRDPKVGDNSYSLASGASTSEGYESDNDANGSDNNPRTKALFTNITNIGPLRGNNGADMLADIHPAFRRAARIRRNSELKIFNSILADYPTGLMVDNALGNTAQAYVDGRAKFKYNILSGNKVGGLTETGTGTALPSGFSPRTFVLTNNNDSTLRADSFLIAPYGVDTTHTLATWGINSFKFADYRPKDSTEFSSALALSAYHGADFTDTSFNAYGTVSCPTVAKPSAISGTSFTVSNTTSDTLKTFYVDAMTGVDAYVWGITGGASGNKIKSGAGTRTVTFIVKSVPCQIFVSATNYCDQGDTVQATISCSFNPTAVTAVTGVKNLTNCTSTLQTYKITRVTGNTYAWAVTGTGNQLVSAAADSAVFAMVSAGNITVTPSTSCATGSAFTYAVSKTAFVAPASISITTNSLVQNVCGARYYRYAAPALTGTATGWKWSLPTSGSVVSTVPGSATIDSTGNLSGQVIVVKYTSNAAAASTDSIRVAYTYDCGVGPNKAAKLTNTALAGPAAPASVTITKLAEYACGQPQYRFSAPALLSATSTLAAPTGYDWTVIGNLGFVKDSGDYSGANARYIKGHFTSNAAAVLGVDSVKVRYSSSCGFTAYKGAKLTNTLLGTTAPVPASITIALIDSTCGAKVYSYTAPTLPAATTTAAAATGYQWTLPTGSSALSTSASLVAGYNLTDRIIRVKFSSNDGAVTGDSIKVRYTSLCGDGLNKAAKLTNVPSTAAPASITISQISTTCGAKVYSYTASVLPVTSTTTAAATGYQWTLPTGTSALSTSASLEPGFSLTDRTINVKFTSDNAAATGDSIKVRYTYTCGTGLNKAAKLTNVATCTPFAGTTVITSKGITTDNNVAVYPNPNNGNFTLSVSTGITAKYIATIQIVDMLGKVVAQTTAVNNNGMIVSNLYSNLNNGVYIVKYTVNGVTNAVRMVVQK
jgi:hypothetical protein